MRANGINRKELNTALAKAIAYKESGNDYEAERWTARLVWLLDCQIILESDVIAAKGDL